MIKDIIDIKIHFVGTIQKNAFTLFIVKSFTELIRNHGEDIDNR